MDYDYEDLCAEVSKIILNKMYTSEFSSSLNAWVRKYWELKEMEKIESLPSGDYRYSSE